MNILFSIIGCLEARISTFIQNCILSGINCNVKYFLLSIKSNLIRTNDDYDGVLCPNNIFDKFELNLGMDWPGWSFTK